jgi:putative NADH-flavin reductase
VRIVVFGANGLTGRQIVAQALEAGHEVTAFVRSPGKAPAPHPRLTVAIGEVTRDQDAVTTAVGGQDAVLSALGGDRTVKGLIMATVIRRATPVIVRAMRDTGVDRVVFLSAFGVGETADRVPLLFKVLYKVLLGPAFADKVAGERVLRSSGLDWTLVYPAMLTKGPRTHSYRVGEHLELSGLAKVSRADVAEFMLEETAERAYLRRIVTVAD